MLPDDKGSMAAGGLTCLTLHPTVWVYEEVVIGLVVNKEFY